MTHYLAATLQAANEIFVKPGPRLGFGTATLHAGRHSTNSTAIVEAAIDNGITYFDTARLYANGEAEDILGRVLSRHRSKIHLASKVGILPAKHSLAQRGLNKVLNIAATRLGLGQILPKPRWAEPEFGVFSADAMRLSLETSLRALKTDYLDVLLLHECSLGDAQNPVVQSFVSDVVTEGKARTWGVATTPAVTMQLADSFGSDIPVYQMSYHAWLGCMAHHHERLGAHVVRHSILAETLPAILAKCERDSEYCRYARSLGFDPDDKSSLVAALMAGALHGCEGGVVLFSTTRPQNVAKTLAAKNVSPTQTRAAQDLARRALIDLNQQSEFA